jgi:soluble lytic murein transglycosylase-like protein
MPRAHPSQEFRQTAAAQQQGSGCLSGFILPPLSVVIVSALLASFALKNIPLEMPPPSSNISPIFTQEIQHWGGSISRWAAASGLDPNLAATVMQIESCGDPRALSSSGAMGLFQVMPFHFRSTDDPYDADTNAVRGLAYLARSLESAHGDARLALAGYNGGIGVIPRGEWTWSAQTKRYVRYGWPIYQDARNGLDSSHSLMEWYESYGVSLCKQARQRLGQP